MMIMIMMMMMMMMMMMIICSPAFQSIASLLSLGVVYLLTTIVTTAQLVGIWGFDSLLTIYIFHATRGPSKLVGDQGILLC